MKKNKILTIAVFILAISGLVLSFIPFYQLWGAALGGAGLLLSVFVLKWIREQNMPEKWIKKAIRYGMYAVLFGFVVAGGCKLHSYLFYVKPLQDEIQPIKEDINTEIQKTKANQEKESP